MQEFESRQQGDSAYDEALSDRVDDIDLDHVDTSMLNSIVATEASYGDDGEDPPSYQSHYDCDPCDQPAVTADAADK